MGSIGSHSNRVRTDPPDDIGEALPHQNAGYDDSINSGKKTLLGGIPGTVHEGNPGTNIAISPHSVIVPSSSGDTSASSSHVAKGSIGESKQKLPQCAQRGQPEGAEKELGEEEDSKKEVEKYQRKVQKRLMDVGYDPEKAMKWAEILVDEEKTKQVFFKHLIEEQRDLTTAASKGLKKKAQAHKKRGFDNSKERQDMYLRKAGKLRVHLLLSELQREDWQKGVVKSVNRYVKKFQYGPFHAALQIGDVLLEWNTMGVVFPERVTDSRELDHCVFMGDVHDRNELTATGKCGQTSVLADAETTAAGYEQQLTSVIELGESRELLLDELARVVVLYNQKYKFGVLRCNCQHFVADVLEVLGIPNKSLFEGKLQVKKHMELLTRRGNSHSAYEFNSHIELDQYVRENIDKLTCEELEFCYFHYLLFHAWQKKQPNVRAWQCPQHACCFMAVELRLNPA